MKVSPKMKSPINIQLLSSLLVAVLLGLVRKIEAQTAGLTLSFSSTQTLASGSGNVDYTFPNPIPMFGASVTRLQFTDDSDVYTEGNTALPYFGLGNRLDCSVTFGPVDSSSRAVVSQELANYEGVTPGFTTTFALMGQWTYPGNTQQTTAVWATDFTETYYMVWYPAIDMTNINADYYYWWINTGANSDAYQKWYPSNIDEDILVIRVTTDSTDILPELTSTAASTAASTATSTVASSDTASNPATTITTTTLSRNSASKLSSTHIMLLSIAVSLSFATLVL